MEGKTFSIGQALSVGWQEYKKNVWHWIGWTVVGFVVVGIVGSLFGSHDLRSSSSDGFSLGFYSGGPLSWLAQIWFGFTFSRLALMTTEGHKPSFDELFKGWPKFLNYFAASILVGIMTFIGLILLIIPGLWVAMTYGQSPYLTLDKKIGPIEAIKMSAKITKGHRWNLFGLGIVSLLIGLVSMIPLGLGLLVSVPVVTIAWAYVYRQISAGVSLPAAPQMPAAPQA